MQGAHSGGRTTDSVEDGFLFGEESTPDSTKPMIWLGRSFAQELYRQVQLQSPAS